MAQYQDTTYCECVEPPICPPPGGNNQGDPLLPTVCGELPDPAGGTTGTTGTGGVDPHGGGVIINGADTEPWDNPPPPPPPPPIGPPQPPPITEVWVCVRPTYEGIPQLGSAGKCKLVMPWNTSGLASHPTKQECEKACSGEGSVGGGGLNVGDVLETGDSGDGSTDIGDGTDVTTGTGLGSTEGESGNTSTGAGTTVQTSNNTPSVVVQSNPFDPYEGGVTRPTVSDHNNVPTPPNNTQAPTPSTVVGSEAVATNNNMPTSPMAPVGDMLEAPTISEPNLFVEFMQSDPTLNIYDKDHNIQIERRDVLKYANMRTRKVGDPGNIFNSVIAATLNDAIGSQGGASYIPFNGVTVGAILKQTQLLETFFTRETVNELEGLAHFNLTSLQMPTLIQQALKRAIINGTLDEYSPALLQRMVNSGRARFPQGLPQIAAVSEAEAAYNFVMQQRKSLDPSHYRSNGNAQQTVRRMRQIPTDIDLTLPVISRSGKKTGARFSNDDGLYITTQDGTIDKPKQVNEFFGIIKQDGTIDKVTLASNRNIAYTLNPYDQTVVDGLLTNLETTTTLELSGPILTTENLNDNLEVSGGGSAIPEAMLFSSMRETITDLSPTSPLYRRTSMKYALAWKTGDDDTKFNDTVKNYIGPRATFYIPSDDPIWNLILSPNEEGATDYFITAIFDSLDIPINDKVYPRRIYTDFMLCPTDKVLYNPLQGASHLETYEVGSPVKRSLQLANAPFAEVNNEAYVKSVRTDTDIDGTANVYGMDWAKNFSSGEIQQRVSKNNLSFSSDKSIFGKVYSIIDRVNANYDLRDGYKGRRLPQGDVISFLTFNEFVDFLTKTPSTIRTNLFSGIYNNIKVFPLLNTDTEKTYINSTRQTGASLESSQIQTTTPTKEYFDPRLKGKLY